MVFTWCVLLVPVALRSWPVDALRRAGAGRVAIGCRLVVRKQSAFSLVRRDRSRHGLLHDSQSNRSPGIQLSSRSDRFLELRVVLELDRDAAPRRWTVPSLAGHS